MKRFVSTYVIIALSFLLVLLPANKASGADCSKPEKLFSSTYDVTFNFNNKGNAVTTQKISLKNLSGDCFVSEFKLRVNSGKVQSVSGSDSLGTVKTNLKKEGDSTILNVKLNDEVIGLGKSTVFTLKYTLVGLAKKEGSIWELDVPNIVTSEKITSYKLRVLVPKSFGNIFSSSTPPKSQTSDKKGSTFVYDKEILEKQGISLSFGDSQLISFQFDLPLENKGLLGKKFFIPLPPDTENQKVLIKSMNPLPETISLDSYGNYLAEYKVSARSLSEVKIQGFVRIVNKENKFGPAKKLSSDELESLKGESSFVQVQDRVVQEKAKNLGELSQIYKFTSGSLTFDKSLLDDKVSRKGSTLILSKLQPATTMEFVDLFTALSRAAGTPTRQVIGVAISNDQESKPTYVGEPIYSNNLHIWTQIYDYENEIWLDVDPTWGSTSKDDYFSKNLSDRFALLITDSDDGLDNLKNLTVLSDSVKATYSSEVVDFSPDIDISIISDQAVAGFPAKLKIQLQNKKGVGLTQIKLRLNLTNLNLVGEEKIDVGVVGPFQKKVLEFKVRGGSVVGKTEGVVEAKLTSEFNGKNFEKTERKEIQVASLFSFGLQQFLLLIIIVLLFAGNLAPRLFPKK